MTSGARGDRLAASAVPPRRPAGSAREHEGREPHSARRETEGERAGSGGRRALARIGWIVFALVFLAAATWGARKAFEELDPADVSRALREIPPRALALAAALAAAHYVALGGYDATSARTVGVAIATRRAALASSVGHAFSHALGFGAVTGGGARVRLYRRWGVPARDVARIVLANATTYSVGLAAWGAVLFLAEPLAVPEEVRWLPRSMKPIGAVCAALLLAYVAVVVGSRVPRRIGRIELPLPQRRRLPEQLAVPIVVWPLNAAIAWSLLPAQQELSFAGFFEVFLLAQIAGLISHVPGGIGVVESVLLVALRGSVPAADVVAALVGYRLFYNVLPFAAALVVVGSSEWRARRGRGARDAGGG